MLCWNSTWWLIVRELCLLKLLPFSSIILICCHRIVGSLLGLPALDLILGSTCLYSSACYAVLVPMKWWFGKGGCSPLMRMLPWGLDVSLALQSPYSSSLNHSLGALWYPCLLSSHLYQWDFIIPWLFWWALPQSPTGLLPSWSIFLNYQSFSYFVAEPTWAHVGTSSSPLFLIPPPPRSSRK